MSDTKHTPGPWVADDNEGFSMWKIYSRMSPSGSWVQGPCVAKVIGDSAEADANARLIAAAPDLLEALKSIAEFWNRDQNEKAMIGACWHAVETAEAAIAKAEGVQP